MNQNQLLFAAAAMIIFVMLLSAGLIGFEALLSREILFLFFLLLLL